MLLVKHIPQNQKGTWCPLSLFFYILCTNASVLCQSLPYLCRQGWRASFNPPFLLSQKTGNLGFWMFLDWTDVLTRMYLVFPRYDRAEGTKKLIGRVSSVPCFYLAFGTMYDVLVPITSLNPLPSSTFTSRAQQLHQGLNLCMKLTM